MGRRRGISLLEVFLSLMLLGVVFGVWVLGHFGRAEVTLESAGKLLVNDLRSAQSHALVMGEPIRVVFDGDTYRAIDRHQTPLIHPRTGLDFVRDYRRDAVFEGVVIEHVESESVPGVLFDARGEIASGARIVLRFGDTRQEIIADSTRGTVTSRALGVGAGPGSAASVRPADGDDLGPPLVD